MESQCKVTGCVSKHYGHGYCSRHYQTAKRQGEIPTTVCSMKHCRRPVLCKGLCTVHYQRQKRHGDPRTKKSGGSPGHGMAWKRCSALGCRKRALARGMCQRHYMYERRHGTLHAETCHVDNCGQPEIARGYCDAHWQLWRKYGVPERKMEYAKTPEEKRSKATVRMRRYRATTHGKIRGRWSRGKQRVTTAWIIPGVTKAQLLALCGQQACGICGEVIAEVDKTIDHIIPLAKGGMHALENLQMAHRLCNQRKRDRILDANEFRTLYPSHS